MLITCFFLELFVHFFLNFLLFHEYIIQECFFKRNQINLFNQRIEFAQLRQKKKKKKKKQKKREKIRRIAKKKLLCIRRHCCHPKICYIICVGSHIRESQVRRRKKESE